MARDVRYWDRVSGRPMKLVEKLDSRGAFEHLIRTTLALRPGDRVLDLGCGTGVNLAALRHAVGEDGEVLGIDYSPKMVEKAKARAAQWDNVEVRQADATTVALDPDHYDAVLASFSISATQDVPAVVRTIHRTLRSGGRLFAPDMHLVPRGIGTPAILAIRLVYWVFAKWTGVDVLTTIRTEFGNATPVNGEGKPIQRMPAFAPVLMITAEKA
jgi:ubiquinone/menaquinone biosynthesis C-methylase UbiE